MIGIISDIHGNHVALEAVLKQLDNMNVKNIVCLGDVVGYYPLINECCETLQQRNIFTLMGNHDWYLTSGERCPRSNSANLCLDYQYEVISQANLNWLRSLKSHAQILGLNVVHGGWNNYLDEYITPSKEYFTNISGSLFASGHTHVPIIWTNEEKSYCNPGSVGQPRDGDFRASFAVLNKNEFLLFRVEYDVRQTQKAMKDAGFDDYFYKNLSYGTRIGND